MDVMLSTMDNPFSPFSEFDDWYSFDEQKGYHTCEYLMRVTNLADGLTPSEEEALVEDSIDEIVKLNVLGIYKKVTSADYQR